RFIDRRRSQGGRAPSVRPITRSRGTETEAAYQRATPESAGGTNQTVVPQPSNRLISDHVARTLTTSWRDGVNVNPLSASPAMRMEIDDDPRGNQALRTGTDDAGDILAPRQRRCQPSSDGSGLPRSTRRARRHQVAVDGSAGRAGARSCVELQRRDDSESS